MKWWSGFWMGKKLTGNIVEDDVIRSIRFDSVSNRWWSFISILKHRNVDDDDDDNDDHDDGNPRMKVHVRNLWFIYRIIISNDYEGLCDKTKLLLPSPDLPEALPLKPQQFDNDYNF